MHAPDAPEIEDRARRHRPGVSGRHERIRLPLLDETHRDVNGTVFLRAHRPSRLVVHLKDFGRTHNLKTPRLAGLLDVLWVLGQLGLDRLLHTDEDDLHVIQADCGLDAAPDDFARGLVAAHRIERNARHTPFTWP